MFDSSELVSMLTLFLFLLRICILFLLCSATDDLEDDPDDEDEEDDGLGLYLDLPLDLVTGLASGASSFCSTVGRNAAAVDAGAVSTV